MPSCPYWFEPQHLTVPSPSNAHTTEFVGLELIFFTFVSPGTGVGFSLLDKSVPPRPRTPRKFCPQHRTLPSERSAQL
jgi:hypothetical protein